jgi:hypothetical protein
VLSTPAKGMLQEHQYPSNLAIVIIKLSLHAIVSLCTCHAHITHSPCGWPLCAHAPLSSADERPPLAAAYAPGAIPTSSSITARPPSASPPSPSCRGPRGRTGACCEEAMPPDVPPPPLPPLPPPPLPPDSAPTLRSCCWAPALPPPRAPLLRGSERTMSKSRSRGRALSLSQRGMDREWRATMCCRVRAENEAWGSVHATQQQCRQHCSAAARCKRLVWLASF